MLMTWIFSRAVSGSPSPPATKAGVKLLLILAAVVFAALAIRKAGAANYVAGVAGPSELDGLPAYLPPSESDGAFPIRLPNGEVLEYYGDPADLPDITDAQGIPVPFAPARPN